MPAPRSGGRLRPPGRKRDLRIMVDADFKVSTHGPSGMESRAAVERDMGADDDRAYPIGERVAVGGILEIGALDGLFGDCVFLDSRGGHRGLHQFSCHDIILAVCVYGAVVIFRPEADGEVCRKRPGRRGPDDEIGLLRIAAERIELAFAVLQLEFYIDGPAAILLILDSASASAVLHSGHQ